MISPISSTATIYFAILTPPETAVLALSSIRVYLAAILAFHLHIQDSSIFFHHMIVRFLKGLEKLFQ